MKKWLILLALSLLVTGCGDKKENQTKEQSAKAQNKDAKSGKGMQAKNKTKNNEKNKEKSTVLMKDVGTNKHDLVLFLNRAENVFEDLHYAAAIMTNGKKINEDGITYRELPAPYDTKEKIITYFSRFWSRPIAVNMYDNLHTKIVKGKVYIAQEASEYHVLITVQNTTVETDIKGITATVKEATLPAFSTDRTITYRLVRDKKTKQFEINQRLGTYGAKLFD